MTLAIPKENPGTLLWRLLLQHTGNFQKRLHPPPPPPPPWSSVRKSKGWRTFCSKFPKSTASCCLSEIKTANLIIYRITVLGMACLIIMICMWVKPPELLIILFLLTTLLMLMTRWLIFFICNLIFEFTSSLDVLSIFFYLFIYLSLIFHAGRNRWFIVNWEFMCLYVLIFINLSWCSMQ